MDFFIFNIEEYNGDWYMIVFDNDKRFSPLDYQELRKYYSYIRSELIRSEAESTGHTGWELLWGKDGILKRKDITDEQSHSIKQLYDNYQKYEDQLRKVDEPAHVVLHNRIVAAKVNNDAMTHINCLHKMYEMELKQHELLMNYHNDFVRKVKEIVNND